MIIKVLACALFVATLFGNNPSHSSIEHIFDRAGSKISLIRHTPRSFTIVETYGTAMRNKTKVAAALAGISGALSLYWLLKGPSRLEFSPNILGCLGASASLLAALVWYDAPSKPYSGLQQTIVYHQLRAARFFAMLYGVCGMLGLRRYIKDLPCECSSYEASISAGLIGLFPAILSHLYRLEELYALSDARQESQKLHKRLDEELGLTS